MTLQPSPARGLKSELVQTTRLAAPIMLFQLGFFLMSVVDSLYVARLGTRPLASIAVGNAFQWAVLIPIQGVLLALDPLLAQAIGAGRRDAAGIWARHGFVLAAVLAFLALIAFLCAQPILKALKLPPELIPPAAGYLKALAAGVPPLILFVVVRMCAQADLSTRPLLIAVVAGNLVNVLGDWILIFGHFHVKQYGLVGAGWSTTVARYVMIAILLITARPQLSRLQIFARSAKVESGRMRELLSQGLPSGASAILDAWVFSLGAFCLAAFGSIAVATHQIAFDLLELTFQAPSAIARATAIRVGLAIGRKETEGARSAAFAGIVLAAAAASIPAGSFLLSPGWGPHLYRVQGELLGSATSVMRWVSLFPIVEAVELAASAACRGAGDTRGGAIVSIIARWAIGLPVALMLVFLAGMGTKGFWIGITIGVTCGSILQLVRLRGTLARLIRS